MDQNKAIAFFFMVNTTSFLSRKDPVALAFGVCSPVLPDNIPCNGV